MICIFFSLSLEQVVNHQGMLDMLNLWEVYEDLLLCQLDGLPEVTPQEIDKFKEQQHTH